MENHTPSARYFVEYRAYAEVAESGLGVSVRSPGGDGAIRIGFLNGQFGLSTGEGPATLPGSYPLNTVHTVRIEVNLDARTASVAIDGVTVAADRPFLDLGFSGLDTLRFDYAPASVEALPGSQLPPPEGAA